MTLEKTLKMVAPGSVSSPRKMAWTARRWSSFALVDDQHGLAAALVDGLGPGEEGDERHAVEPHTAEVPLVDADGLGGTTVAARRQGVELAGATIVAVARHQLDAREPPIDPGHDGTRPLKIIG
jgi:hypothetical protein